MLTTIIFGLALLFSVIAFMGFAINVVIFSKANEVDNKVELILSILAVALWTYLFYLLH